MHRAIESFLPAVISLPLIVAAVCGYELFRSPACCRRDGMSGEKTRLTQATSLLALILNGLIFNEVPGDRKVFLLVLCPAF